MSDTVTEKLEDLHSEMESHELVVDSELVEVDSTDGVDEVHITVEANDLEQVKSEVGSMILSCRFCIRRI